MLFEQVPEVEDGGFVGNRVTEQINLQKFLEGVSVVDRFLDPRITQVIPLLQEMGLEHHLQFLVLPAKLFLYVEGRNDIQHRRPRHNPLHLVQEFLALEFLLVGDGKERWLGGHEN